MNDSINPTNTTDEKPLEVRGVKIPRGISVRESGASRDLLEGMLDQTYRPYRHLPGVAEAMQMGLGPYDTPDAFDGVRRIDAPGHRAVEFVRSGTYFLIWAGSAAKEDEKGNNAYVEHLASLIETFQLEELVVSTFSRLVRSQNVQGRLRATLVRAGTKVYCTGQVMDMSTEHGRMMWDIQALVYSMDRDQIERRMVLGELYGASRGVWVPGETMVPPGYDLVETDGERRLQVSTDPVEVERIRAMIGVLAGPGSARDKVEALAELGVKRHVFRDGRRRTARIDKAQYPGGTIRTLHGYRHLYRDGVYVYRRQVPKLHGIDEIAGFPVQTDGDEHFVEAPLEVGLPEGGWASDDLFIQWDALIQRNALTSPTNYGGAEHERAKPLTGMCRYDDGANEYALLSDGSRAYQLRERPIDPARVGRGWYEDRANTAVVADFDAHELHAAIAAGVRHALTSGCGVELRDAEVGVRDDGTALVLFVDDETRKAAVDDRIARLQEQLSRLAGLAADAGNEVLAQEYNSRAERVVEEIERARRLLETNTSQPAREPDNLVVHGRTLLRALDALASIETMADRDVAKAVRQVFTDLRFELDAETARWQVDVYLPTTEGLAILRGVSGEVPRFCREARYKAATGWSDAARALAEDLATGRTTEELLATDRRHGVALSKEHLRRTVRRAGVPPAGRRFVSGHPIPEVRALVVGTALGRCPATDWDPNWVDLVQTTVNAWNPDRYLNRSEVTWATERQPALDALHNAGGELPLADLAHVLGVGQPGKLARQLGYRCAKPGANWDELRADRQSFQLVQAQDGRLSLSACPSCAGSEWTVVNLPEWRGLLCRQCLHGDGIRFPESYRQWTTLKTLGTAIRKMRSSVESRLSTVPDGAFTMTEWGENVGTAGSSMNDVRKQLIHKGLLEDLGPSQTQLGPGMVPTLYRLTAKGRRLKRAHAWAPDGA